MTAHPVDTVLIVAWLVFAHLVADFVLQNDWIAVNKANGTRIGWSALGVHGSHVALCLVPVVFAYGAQGLAYLALVTLTHMAVDRWKVQATRVADARAQARARERLARGALSGSGLGEAWTPWPGMLFLADQALHLTIALVGWLVILESSALMPAFVDFVNAVIRSWDPAAFHAVVLTGVVLVSLFLVNTRGAYYFALAMVAPRTLRPAPDEADGAEALAGAAPRVAGAAPSVGDAAPRAGDAAPTGASARIAVTVMAMERLLIASLVVTGMALAAVLVVALDVAARWRQLGDRGFAEWYLVATLGSVSVALASGLLALAALASLG
ncbi:MAG: hypothetical protein A2V85_17980 [Chloroflexi bacterium RBG_16_72_14]|nr:MAG: hypothetical protein A2V85_17980 [Chloroflexi bacterium RBG_16_72_14]